MRVQRDRTRRCHCLGFRGPSRAAQAVAHVMEPQRRSSIVQHGGEVVAVTSRCTCYLYYTLLLHLYSNILSCLGAASLCSQYTGERAPLTRLRHTRFQALHQKLPETHTRQQGHSASTTSSARDPLRPMPTPYPLTRFCCYTSCILSTVLLRTPRVAAQLAS
jgi:hypothetical protein